MIAPILSEKSSECDGCEPMDIQTKSTISVANSTLRDFGSMAEQALTFEGFLDEQ